jgi:hypothetical protein
MAMTPRFTSFALATFITGVALGTYLGATLWPNKEVVIREGTPHTPAAITSVNLMVDNGNGTVKTWNTVTHHEAMSAVNLLETVAAANNITLTLANGSDGKPAVASINGIANDAKGAMRWQYWINNTYEPTTAAKYFLRPGDIVMWKYVREQKISK